MYFQAVDSLADELANGEDACWVVFFENSSE